MKTVDTYSPKIASKFAHLFAPTPPGLVDQLLKTLGEFDRAISSQDKTRKPALPIRVPDKLLSRPLTVEEKTLVNSSLGSEYAQEAVSAQKKIARVPIKESFEPLVNLPNAVSEKSGLQVNFSQKPYHPSCGDWAGKDRLFWVRQSFADKILPLFNGLNQIGIIPRVEDSFRPVGVQEGLFKRRYLATQIDHPTWNEKEVIAESMSKTAVTPRLASHKAGAALDFMLTDKRHQDLDIGNTYPEGGAVVKIDCPYVTPEQWLHRQIFKKTAEVMDLSLYPWENWHVSYKDNLSGFNPDTLSRRPNVVANYGPIKEFDRSNGIIQKIYSKSELDDTFSIK